MKRTIDTLETALRDPNKYVHRSGQGWTSAGTICGLTLLGGLFAWEEYQANAIDVAQRWALGLCPTCWKRGRLP